MSQPRYAVIRLNWLSAANLTVALNEAIARIVEEHKAEVRIVAQSHDADEILYTVQVGR